MGADEHKSETGGTDDVVPGEGLGNDRPPDAAALADEDAEAEGDGEWVTRAVELLPHALRTISVAMARPERRFFTRSRILTAGAPHGEPGRVDAAFTRTGLQAPVASGMPFRIPGPNRDREAVQARIR